MNTPLATPAPDVPTAHPTRLLRAGIADPRPLWGWVVGGAFLVLHLQTLTLTGALVTAESGPALKPYHLALVALGLLPLVRRRLPVPRTEVVLYTAVMVGTSVVAYTANGAPHAMLFNLLFALWAALIGGALGAEAGSVLTLRGLRWASGALALAVAGKAVLHREAIVRFFVAPNGHPDIPSFVGGGPNLEATWLALGGLFWLGRRALWPYLGLSLALSACYASRIGILLTVAIALLAVVRAALATGAFVRLARRATLASMAVAVLGAGVASLDNPVGDYVAQRFSAIGDEPGSVGRLTLWAGGARAFASQPWGSGIGRGVAAVERAIGANLPEDNLHNLYLQHFVEGGVLGGLAFLLFASLTLARVLRQRASDPLLAFVGAYFVAGLLQFRGADAIAWFVFGLATGTVARQSVPPLATQVEA